MMRQDYIGRAFALFICFALLIGGVTAMDLNNTTTQEYEDLPDLAVFADEMKLDGELKTGGDVSVSVPVHQLGATTAKTFHDGDYGEYDFEVATDKVIDIKVRAGVGSVNSPQPTGFRLKLDGNTLYSDDLEPGFEIITVDSVSVTEGTHTLRVEQTTDGSHQNLQYDWIKFGDQHREAELFDRTGAYNYEPEEGFDRIFPNNVTAKFYVDGELIDSVYRIATDERYLPRLDVVPYGHEDSKDRFITNGDFSESSINWIPEEDGVHTIRVEVEANCRPDDGDLTNNILEKTVYVDPEGSNDNDQENTDNYSDYPDLAVFADEMILNGELKTDGDVSISVPVHQLGVTSAKTFHDGDYGEYDFEVASDKVIDIKVRAGVGSVNSPQPTGFRLKLDGDTLYSDDLGPGFEIITVNSVSVTEGTHTLRVEQTTDGSHQNLQYDWIEFGEQYREAELFDRTGAYNYEPEEGFDRIFPDNVTASFYVDGKLIDSVYRIGTDERYLPRLDVVPYGHEDSIEHFITNGDYSKASINWVPDQAGEHTIRVEVTANYRPDDKNLTNNVFETTIDIDGDDKKPVADFSYSPSKPLTSETIKFTDLSNDTDGTILNWTWDFNDGVTTYDQNPSHSFDEEGKYTISLKVTDDDGLTDEKSIEIIIYKSNYKPSADFTYIPNNPSTNDNIKFTDESEDPDGDIYEWLWDFGDGDRAFEQNPTHSYKDDGTYQVSLKVTDEEGYNDIISKDIIVNNTPPESDIEVYREMGVQLRVTGVPNNTVSALIYENNQLISELETTREEGLPDIDEDEFLIKENEDYTIKLIYDATEQGANPTWLFISSSVKDSDIKVTFNTENGYHQSKEFSLDGNISDVFNGDGRHIFSAKNSYDDDGYIQSYEWDFGDGTSANGIEVKHEYASAGAYDVTLTVEDDDGGIDTTQITIDVDELEEEDEKNDGGSKETSSILPVKETMSNIKINGGLNLTVLVIVNIILFSLIAVVYFVKKKNNIEEY